MRSFVLSTRSLLLVAIGLALTIVPTACQELTEGTSTTQEPTTTSLESTTTTDPRSYMPQLVGLPEDEARAQLQALGVECEVKGWPTPNNAKHGVVQEQDVPEGTEITPETEVVIKVGREGIEVPGLSGLTDSQARSRVEALGLHISITYDPPPPDPDPGFGFAYMVASQSPGSGSYILVGGTVKVTCTPGGISR